MLPSTDALVIAAALVLMLGLIAWLVYGIVKDRRAPMPYVPNGRIPADAHRARRDFRIIGALVIIAGIAFYLYFVSASNQFEKQYVAEAQALGAILVGAMLAYRGFTGPTALR